MVSNLFFDGVTVKTGNKPWAYICPKGCFGGQGLLFRGRGLIIGGSFVPQKNFGLYLKGFCV